MRTIIAGSRSINNIETVCAAVAASNIPITQVVSGNARGVDKMGEHYAAHYNIPVAIFPADWNTYGKSAGYRRNLEMAENADALIAIWDGVSRGTKHMIDIARMRGLRVYVHRVSMIPYRPAPPDWTE